MKRFFVSCCLYILLLLAVLLPVTGAKAANYPLFVYGNPTDFASSTPYNYGSNSVPEGNDITNTLTADVGETNSARYAFTGWSFSNRAGLVTNGTTTQAVFNITTNSYLTWNWTNPGR